MLRSLETYSEKILTLAPETQIGIKQTVNFFFSYCMEKGTFEQSEIAFEQSEIDTEDKYRLLTNWKTFQENGFTLPGVKEKHDWCGVWQAKGCLHSEDHNGKVLKKVSLFYQNRRMG